MAGFLQHQDQVVVVGSLDEAQQATVSTFRERNAERLDSEWARRRNEVMDGMGYKAGAWGAQSLSFTGPGQQQQQQQSQLQSQHQSNLSASFSAVSHGNQSYYDGQAGIPQARQGPHPLSQKMVTYARVVGELNENRAGRNPYPLVHNLMEANRRTDDRSASKAEVGDCFRALASMVGEKDVSAGHFTRGLVTEGQFGATMALPRRAVERLFIDGACEFLEKQYDEHITKTVADNPNTARLGPRPGLIYRIRAFLNVRLAGMWNKSWPADAEAVVDGYPLWMQIYLCMRCGDLDAALEVARSAPAVSGEFVSFLAAYKADPCRMLPAQLWRQLTASYNQFAGPTAGDSAASDGSYKQVCYNLLGRCDSAKMYPKVLSLTPDFLWYRLRLVTDPDVALPATLTPCTQSLASLQQMLCEYGPSHFNPQGRSPLLYFQVLLLSQQFERAVHYLCTASDSLGVEAVHFALALSYYGIVPQPDTLNSDPSGLNTARLLRQYVRAFAQSDPREALQYLLVIADERLRDEAVRDLVTQTGEFDLFFGGLAEDGTRRPGALARVLKKESVERVAMLTAEECERNGLHEAAVSLYEECRDHDRALAILNRQLSHVLIADSSNPERQVFVNLAHRFEARCLAQASFVHLPDQARLTTFRVLLELCDYFSLVSLGRTDEALGLVQNLGIVPFDAGSAHIEERAAAFRLMDPAVRAAFGHVLLSCMSILHAQYTQAKGARGQLQGGPHVEAIRQRASAIVSFAGMVQSHLSQDVSAGVIRLMVLLS